MDKYDIAIQYLTENPDRIADAWADPQVYEARCLFAFASKTRHVIGDSSDSVGCLTMISVGCLTMIRSGRSSHVENSDKDSRLAALESEIRADERIPLSWDAIQLSHLPVFAEWQRRLDKELNRCV